MSYYVTNENSVLNINNAHLRVSGNVITDVMKLGAIEFAPSGSTVGGTVNFTNVTTGVTTSSNLSVGGTLSLGTVEVVATTHTLANTTANGNVTPHTVQFSNATTGIVTTANVEVGGELTVSGNVAVGTNKLFVDTVGGTVGIGSTLIDITDNILSGAGNGLYIHNPVQGGHLLTLGTQRPWVFEQGLSDASTQLCLRYLNSGKKFNIQSPDHSNVMTVVATNGGGNVGIGTDSPDGGLHVYGNTFILGQIASAPSGPDGTMYYNSTTNQPLIKVNGSWISLVNFSPSNISGLVGWYLPENWTGSQWTDASGVGNHVTASEGTINYTASHSGSSVGANGSFPVLYGDTAAELNFPSAILPTTFTMISMTRYNGSTKQRILDGQTGNWLSGHWGGASGVAYHNGWLTTTTDRHGSNWVIGVDQNSLYRSKSQSVAWTNDTGGGGTSTNLRLGSVDYEASEWMCAELIVYNRTLSSDEYTQLADYMQNKYGIY